MGSENTKTIAMNKKAFHDYFVEESAEAGIELTGTEVKSIRQGGINLKDAWCAIENGELLVKGMHISPYAQAGNYAIPRHNQAAGIDTDPPLSVFQGIEGEGATRALQG